MKRLGIPASQSLIVINCWNYIRSSYAIVQVTAFHHITDLITRLYHLRHTFLYVLTTSNRVPVEAVLKSWKRNGQTYDDDWLSSYRAVLRCLSDDQVKRPLDELSPAKSLIIVDYRMPCESDVVSTISKSGR